MDQSFDSFNADARGAVVFTVPHAGRDYPSALTKQLAVGAAHVARLEDRFSDLLVRGAVEAGWRTLIARCPRLVIDLNRAETDFESGAVAGARTPAPRPSHRARGGLGLVPTRLGPVSLWRTPLPASELAARITTIHRPWHMAVAAALTDAHAANAHAVLIDVHSMPPLPEATAPEIVIGNRHGLSARSELTQLVCSFFRESGLRVALNTPYAGAHMLERHGRPSAGISALQIEFDRRLYLDAALDQPGVGLARIRALLVTLAQRIDAAATLPSLIAAE